MLCARVVRGMASVAKAVTPRAASARAEREVAKRHERPDIDRAGVQPGDLVASAVHRRRPHLEHDIGTADQRGRIRLDGDAELAIAVVRIARRDAGAGLDPDLVSRLHELLAGLGHQRHAPLAGGGLLGNSDAHRDSGPVEGSSNVVRNGRRSRRAGPLPPTA